MTTIFKIGTIATSHLNQKEEKMWSALYLLANPIEALRIGVRLVRTLFAEKSFFTLQGGSHGNKRFSVPVSHYPASHLGDTRNHQTKKKEAGIEESSLVDDLIDSL